MSALALAAQPASAGKQPEPPAETFAYSLAQDRNLRVAIDAVRTKGDEGYNPGKAGWLQLHVSISNIGRDVVSFQSLRGQFATGQTVNPAIMVAELNKAPSMTGAMAKSVGLGTAGMAAGMFIAPPLAIAVGLGSLLGITKGGDRSAKRTERIASQMLIPTDLASGGRTEGDVYLPAAPGQIGLIAFYAVDGKVRTLTVRRTGIGSVPAITAPESAETDGVAAEPTASPAKSMQTRPRVGKRPTARKPASRRNSR